MSAEESPGKAPEQVEAFEPLPGDLLRGGRERRAWTREQAARALNLDVATVAALEENRFDDLGAPVFAKGHLLKYASTLGLDTVAVTRAYLAHVGTQADPEMPSSLAAPVEAAPGDEGHRGPWVAVLVMIALAALGVLLWKVLANGTAPEATPGAAVPATAPPSSRAGDTLTLPGAPPTAPGTDEPVAGADGAAAVTDGAAGPEATTAPVAAASAGPGTGRLEIVFAGESWVEIRDEAGERLLYELGSAGSTRRVEGLPPFRIVLGDAGAVRLRFDGDPVPVPPEVRAGRRAAFELWRENGEIVISREPGGE